VRFDSRFPFSEELRISDRAYPCAISHVPMLVETSRTMPG
jgi:hypothetical protein